MKNPNSKSTNNNKAAFKDRSKPDEIRYSNIHAAKAVSDALRTSLGPKGMDKMIQSGNGEVTITNDGATILKQIKVMHPAAKMLVELSRNQDAEAGDGTTSVVIIAGALLGAAEKLLKRGIHPTTISDAFQIAAEKSIEVLKSISTPIDLTEREKLIKNAATALNSKVVSHNSSILAPMAVDAVLKIIEPGREQFVDLKNIRLIQKLGGTVEDTEMVDGLVFTRKSANVNGPKRVEKAKIGLIQFCISAPKTDMDHNVVISDYTAMDRVLRDERNYILNIVKQIKKSGCNVLLVQKSILRDALSDLAIHFLDKIKVMVIKDVEREDIEFVSKTLNCRPIASLDHFTADNLVQAELAEEFKIGAGRFVRITGIQNPGRTVSILVRGSNKLILAEAERSLHDALCVIRCLVRQPAIIVGGGAPEIELSIKLAAYADTIEGIHAYCIREYAEALEVIPYTLAENAGLNPIETVTELRNKHAEKDVNAGINVRKSMITNILDENVVQPLLVLTSAINLGTETVRSILKIDDVAITWLKFSKRNVKPHQFKSEKYFFDPKSKENVTFPSWNQKPTKYLSVIVPAYNEERRLPKMLTECLSYLEARKEKSKLFDYEVIVVNDGSKDRTSKVALKYVSKFGSDFVRVLDLVQNRGKGGAVKMGVQRARGMIILFADADGATKFSDFGKLEKIMVSQTLPRIEVSESKMIVVGSRAHLEEESKSKRNIFRTFLMYGFHFLVSFFIIDDVRDTQCGFKLFSRDAARTCFKNLHIERWAFDVELLFIAKKKKIKIQEIAVNWVEIDGSKIIPVVSWVQMGIDLLLLWAKYYVGIWRVKA